MLAGSPVLSCPGHTGTADKYISVLSYLFLLFLSASIRTENKYVRLWLYSCMSVLCCLYNYILSNTATQDVCTPHQVFPNISLAKTVKHVGSLTG